MVKKAFVERDLGPSLLGRCNVPYYMILEATSRDTVPGALITHVKVFLGQRIEQRHAPCLQKLGGIHNGQYGAKHVLG